MAHDGKLMGVTTFGKLFCDCAVQTTAFDVFPKGAATAFGSAEPTPLRGPWKGQVTAAHTALPKSTIRWLRPDSWHRFLCLKEYQ